MNILILNSYTKNITWNNYGTCDYGKLASKNHLEYAQHHDYSFLSVLADEEKYSDRSLTWIKIDMIKRELPNYDYVVWIDADAIFVNFEAKIEHFLDNDPKLIITKMEKDRNQNKVWTSTTTGFMVWKNCDWSMNMLNNLWDYKGEYIKGYFHEQSVLDYMLYDYLKLNDNLLNKKEEDLQHPVLLKDILVLPYLYQRCYEDGDMEYIYHAGGETPTKFDRLFNFINGMKNGKYNKGYRDQ